jgi:hypothetical protein
VVAACFVLACASEPAPRAPPREAQTYAEAVQLFCDVDRAAGVDADDVLDAEARRTEYLVEHVKNSDGIYLLTVFRASDPRAQAGLLEEATHETQSASCPFLAVLRERARVDAPAPAAAKP